MPNQNARACLAHLSSVMASKAHRPMATLSISGLTASPGKKPRPHPSDATAVRSPEKTLTGEGLLGALKLDWRPWLCFSKAQAVVAPTEKIGGCYRLEMG